MKNHLTTKKNKEDLYEVYGDISYFKEEEKIKVKNSIYNIQPFSVEEKEIKIWKSFINFDVIVTKVMKMATYRGLVWTERKEIMRIEFSEF